MHNSTLGDLNKNHTFRNGLKAGLWEPSESLHAASMKRDQFVILEKQGPTLLSKTRANIDEAGSEQDVHVEQCDGRAAAQLTPQELQRDGVLGARLANLAVRVTAGGAPC